MSSSDLKKSCKEIVEELRATANAQKGSMRKKLINQKGQILIINKKRFMQTLSSLLPQLKGSKNQKHRDAIWESYDTYLQGLANYIEDKRRIQLEEFVVVNRESLKIRATDQIYYVQTYKAASTAKSKALINIVEKYFQKNEIAYSDDDLRRVAGSDNKAGAQLGHAETVKGQHIGMAASTVRAARAKQMVSNFSGTGRVELDNIIGSYETKMKLVMDHSQLYDKNGNFKKEYIPILSWQGTLDNQEQKNLEQAAIAALIKDFEDLANKPGSTTMKNAIGQIILYNVAGKKQRNKKVTGTAKKKVREKSAGQASSKVSLPRGVQVARDDSIDASVANVGVASRRAGGSPDLRYLISQFNAKIEETVIRNMGEPRLTNRTGRFARSVEVLDITTTPQGFPSVGYTYDKYPYQTFEPGFRQGSVDRDPRRVIDVSLREIAKDFAIGRFYTRRV